VQPGLVVKAGKDNNCSGDSGEQSGQCRRAEPFVVSKSGALSQGRTPFMTVEDLQYRLSSKSSHTRTKDIDDF
jgi:hypothetical protein